MITPVFCDCFSGDRSNSCNDITSVSPGAFGATSDNLSSQQSAAMLERMNLDIMSLKKQYWRIQRKQMRAHVVYAPGSKSQTRAPGNSASLYHNLLDLVKELVNVNQRSKRCERCGEVIQLHISFICFVPLILSSVLEVMLPYIVALL